MYAGGVSREALPGVGQRLRADGERFPKRTRGEGQEKNKRACGGSAGHRCPPSLRGQFARLHRGVDSLTIQSARGPDLRSMRPGARCGLSREAAPWTVQAGRTIRGQILREVCGPSCRARTEFPHSRFCFPIIECGVRELRSRRWRTAPPHAVIRFDIRIRMPALPGRPGGGCWCPVALNSPALRLHGRRRDRLPAAIAAPGIVSLAWRCRSPPPVQDTARGFNVLARLTCESQRHRRKQARLVGQSLRPCLFSEKTMPAPPWSPCRRGERLRCGRGIRCRATRQGQRLCPTGMVA